MASKAEATLKRANGAVQDELESARTAAMEAFENLISAKDKFYGAAKSAGLEVSEEARKEINDVLGAASEKTSEIKDRSETYARENPLAVAGIAFAAGLLISRFIKS